MECVVNVSEGRDTDAVARLAAAAGPVLLDLHRDPEHHRSVFTLVGEPDAVDAATRSLARTAVASLDLRVHSGVHPRTGVLDVVPFVPYEPGALPPRDLAGAVSARDHFARWLGEDLGVPAYLYGPRAGASVERAGRSRTLPEIRRLVREAEARWADLTPDFGPSRLDPRTGVTAVGARGVLVAYNVWVSSEAVARRVAPMVRSPEVRALGLRVGSRAQVSCNLVDPTVRGPAQVYDAISALAAKAGGAVEGAELVGLVPEAVLASVPAHRWTELGFSADSTVEARLPAG